MMTKLEELINELCPDGVEYKKIGDVCDILRGKRLTKKELSDEGKYPVLHGGSSPMGYYNEYNRKANTTVVVNTGNAGSVFFYDKEFWSSDACFSIYPKGCLRDKFIFFFLSSNEHKLKSRIRYGAMPTIDSLAVETIKIPVPPLEVQDEIVKILDNFTLLTAELTAELTARQKQYAFYRDYLLGFTDEDITKKIPDIDCSNVEYKRLGDIATAIYRGAGIKRDEVTETGIPCVRYGEIYTTYNVTFNNCVSHTDEDKIQNKKYFEHGDVLFAITGESVEEIAKSCVYLGHDKCLAGGDIVVLKHNQNPKYMAYVLSTTNAQSQKSKGKVKSKVVHSSVPAISDIIIPIPPLSEQEKIANMIERFDHLCNDISNGLPAEIKARKKQYEYYRDTLLSFDDKACSHIVKVERERELSRSKAIKWLKLSEIASIIRGGNFQKKDFVEQGKPCIHYGQIYTRLGTTTSKSITYLNDDVYSKSKKAMPNDIVMAVTSENIEDVCKSTVWLGNEDLAVSGHTAIIHPSINSKYLAYYFQTTMFFKQKRKLAHGTKVIEVTPDKLNDIIVPVPPFEEQERIVFILDRFDKLCNDISEGLPAEIEARQKQYEYYRDKLLTFKIRNA